MGSGVRERVAAACGVWSASAEWLQRVGCGVRERVAVACGVWSA